MKKLLPLTVAAFFCFLFISCKKDNLTNEIALVANEEKVAGLKQYFNSGVKNNPAFKLHGEPDWDNVYKDGGTIYVPILVNISGQNDKVKLKSFWVIDDFEANPLSHVVYILDDLSSHRSSDIAYMINIIKSNKKYEKGKVSVGLLGEIYGRDPGTLKNVAVMDVRLKENISSNSFISEFDCEAHGGTWVTIEWWYQVYDQYGNVIFEEWIYNSNECWGGSGNPGGGDGPNNQYNCTQIDLAEIAGTGAPTSMIISSQMVSLSSTEKTFERTWRFHMQPVIMPFGATYTVWFKSIDRATQKKEGKKWKWDINGFNHQGHFKEGFTAVITVNLTSFSSSGAVGEGPIEGGAKTTLNYSIETALVCQGFPISITENYSTYTVWVINNEIYPQSVE